MLIGIVAEFIQEEQISLQVLYLTVPDNYIPCIGSRLIIDKHIHPGVTGKVAVTVADIDFIGSTGMYILYADKTARGFKDLITLDGWDSF
jgi:hypothetical protein